MKNIDIGNSVPPAGAILAAPLPAVQDSMLHALKPKGACWYCNAPLDNIKRFCNKTCAQDYQIEEETFR